MRAAFTTLDYRDRFWPGRRYEDQCDRIALRALLPPTGGRILDVGAGFGRLADEYGGYREVVLVDPSEAMLEGARERVGGDERMTFLAGDAQRLPMADRSCDAVVCIRVLHHIGDPRPAIAEFARVLRPGGVLVLEAANKRNLKAIFAYLLRRRPSPLGRGSVAYEGFALFEPSMGSRHPGGPHRRGEPAADRPWTSPGYLHAPADLRRWLHDAGFTIQRTRSAGLLRPAWLTRHAPGGFLIGLERVLQPALAPVTPGPSLFVAAIRGIDPPGTWRGGLSRSDP
jgi:SAM-dependent methyltransferase